MFAISLQCVRVKTIRGNLCCHRNGLMLHVQNVSNPSKCCQAKEVEVCLHRVCSLCRHLPKGTVFTGFAGKYRRSPAEKGLKTLFCRPLPVRNRLKTGFNRFKSSFGAFIPPVGKEPLALFNRQGPALPAKPVKTGKKTP